MPRMRSAHTLQRAATGGLEMFHKEEQCIEQAEVLLRSVLNGTVAEQPFTELLDVARKLLRQSRRLVTMGDRMQAQLSTLNNELAHMARTDALTGLDNRRHFMDMARREFSRSRRTGASFSLLLVDADHFKSINDTWGHDVGDRALQAIATLLKTSVRSHDTPARFGGEEFTILLPDTGCHEAGIIAERIRAAVENNLLMEEQRPVRFTVSIGCTTANARDGEVDLDGMFKRADVALYAAKKNGRNRIEHYPGPECIAPVAEHDTEEEQACL